MKLKFSYINVCVVFLLYDIVFKGQYITYFSIQCKFAYLFGFHIVFNYIKHYR